MSHSEPTYEAKCCFTDMLTLDESIQGGTVLIFNSDRIYKNDTYLDMPALTGTRSISLPNFAYHMKRENITYQNSIASQLQKNNISRIIFIHYPDESFKDELLRNNITKNSRAFVDISKFNRMPTYNYILEKSVFEGNIELSDNKIATIYNIQT
ncbi:MAG: hypothetical protein O8C61_04430 [Candidatus Methanoperedens sp.]|nr:hypothetical protein [Candidatus Methanoperedens sp.]